MSERPSTAGRDWPTVSVIMPVRNEAADLERAVASILAQEYPLSFDVCLAVAPSKDDTEAVAAALAESDPRISVVPNPAGSTPAGLNAAITATTGEIVVRVDGHAALSTGYIRGAVETIRRTGAVNVGGVQAARGETRFEQAVATAMTSWLGTGGSRFHVGGTAGPVDTVYLGVFDRTAGDAAGWFDESLVRNQDYEFNIRLREAGGTIWFDPELSVRYRPRSSLRSLARQYYEYGLWKAEVVRRHPSSVRVRQVVPAALPMAILVPMVTGKKAALAPGLAYLALVGATSIMSPGSRIRVALVYLTIHVSWAIGMWAGLCRAVVDRVRRKLAR